MILEAWVGSTVWCQQRLKTRHGTSVMQQVFRLRHADELHWTAAWGHDVHVLASAVRESSVTDRSARFVEQLGPGVRRETRLVRLLLGANTRLEDAGHLVFPDVSLRVLGAQHLLANDDNLAYGPPPDQSAELRQTFAAWSALPLVLWVGDSLTEELALWRTCAALVALPWRSTPTWLARIEVSAVMAVPELLVDALLGARVLSSAEVQRLARRWHAFCAGRRPRGRLHREFDAVLPRRVGRRVRLAARDVELLSAFDAWRTPLQVLRANLEAWPLALHHFREELPVRLQEWAQGPLLERRAVTGRAPWSNHEFRLTTEGRRALWSGVADESLLVPARFGGTPRL